MGQISTGQISTLQAACRLANLVRLVRARLAPARGAAEALRDTPTLLPLPGTLPAVQGWSCASSCARGRWSPALRWTSRWAMEAAEQACKPGCATGPGAARHTLGAGCGQAGAPASCPGAAPIYTLLLCRPLDAAAHIHSFTPTQLFCFLSHQCPSLLPSLCSNPFTHSFLTPFLASSECASASLSAGPFKHVPDAAESSRLPWALPAAHRFCILVCYRSRERCSNNNHRKNPKEVGDPPGSFSALTNRAVPACPSSPLSACPKWK